MSDVLINKRIYIYIYLATFFAILRLGQSKSSTRRWRCIELKANIYSHEGKTSKGD